MSFIVFQLFLGVFNNYDIYAKDYTEPIIKCSVYKDVNNGKIKLKMNVTDNKAIKSVKYALGNHRITFFKNSFYSKKIKNVSVTSTKNISTTLTVKQNTVYTIYAIDKTGNSTIKKVRIKMKGNNESSDSQNDNNNTGTENNNSNNNNKNNNANNSNKNNNANNANNTAPGTNEVRAVWITFLEFSSKGYTVNSFTNQITEMFDKIAASGMNEIYVHVRPFSDAMYRSVYFPWSKYASGKQGVDPGFDPLAIMVNAAHTRNLKLHAYILSLIHI